jgi:hypothetical protein
MNKRKPGPKSTADQAVKISAIEIKRPEPPEELSLAEQETWKAVVATKPADWWRPDTFPLLIGYCKHVEHAKRLDDVTAKFNYPGIREDFGLVGYLDKLLRARDRESRAMVNLARCMRISQQAQMHPKTAGRKTTNTPPPHLNKPWE